MRYYVDIVLISNEEESLGYLWRKLYAQIHLALVEVRDENDLVSIGLAFPKYSDDRFLGDTLRLFSATKEELESLNLEKWLNRLEGYVFVGMIKEVPKDTKFATFGRKQFKSNSEIRRLAKRHAQREQIAYEEALQNFERTEAKYREERDKNRLPYINIKSLSTGHEMKLFIIKKSSEIEQQGKFNTYGLSNTTTVPDF